MCCTSGDNFHQHFHTDDPLDALLLLVLFPCLRDRHVVLPFVPFPCLHIQQVATVAVVPLVCRCTGGPKFPPLYQTILLALLFNKDIFYSS